MPSAIIRLLQHPFQASQFAYYFFTQVFLILLHHLLLPNFPRYQSLRTELQRAYLSSTSLYFPAFTHRLPADYGPNDAAPISGKGWRGYVVPGPDPNVLRQAIGDGKLRVVLYAHGGGYARGEARMYVPYMKRWVDVANEKGMEIVFLSVEYPLSGESPHPSQRDAFIAAYRYLLGLSIPPKNIVFMGDSAGGGLSINSALHIKNSLKLPQPACTILVSPWHDMALSAYEGGNAAVCSDFLVSANVGVPIMTKAFLGPYTPDDPDVNPLFRSTEEVKGLCPQLVFVGAAEFALSDSKDWTRLCRRAGVQCELQVEWGQLHVWALGSQWIEPGLRRKTDERVLGWIERWSSGKQQQQQQQVNGI